MAKPRWTTNLCHTNLLPKYSSFGQFISAPIASGQWKEWEGWTPPVQRNGVGPGRKICLFDFICTHIPIILYINAIFILYYLLYLRYYVIHGWCKPLLTKIISWEPLIINQEKPTPCPSSGNAVCMNERQRFSSASDLKEADFGKLCENLCSSRKQRASRT